MDRSRVFPGLGRTYEETKRVSRILELIQAIAARPGRFRRRDLAARFEISERISLTTGSKLCSVNPLPT